MSEQALAAGWRRDLPSAWTNSAVAVYASSLGNFFFRHIADRIADGLRASGVRVYPAGSKQLEAALMRQRTCSSPPTSFFTSAAALAGVMFRRWPAASC